MVANCPWLNDDTKKEETGNEGPSGSKPAGDRSSNDDDEEDKRIGNPLSHYQMNQDQAMEDLYRAGRGWYYSK